MLLRRDKRPTVSFSVGTPTSYGPFAPHQQLSQNGSAITVEKNELELDQRAPLH